MLFEIISHIDYDLPTYEVHAGDRVFDIALVQGMWGVHEHGGPIGADWYPTLSAAIAAVEAIVETA